MKDVRRRKRKKEKQRDSLHHHQVDSPLINSRTVGEKTKSDERRNRK